MTMMNKLTLFVALTIGAFDSFAQTARLQVIHNCADAAASEVDVYLNGTALLDDFAFRTATPFIDAPAGVPLTVAIAPGSSTNVGDAIFSQTFTLDDGATYVMVAGGIVSQSGYFPTTPFALTVFGLGQEVAAGGAGMTDVLVFHGATDAPVVDIFESALVEATVVDDLGYGEFAGYLPLPTLDLTVQVRDQYNSAIVAAYSAPLATLDLGGSALVALASGFLDPAMNSNGPAFGIWVALPAGGALVPLPAATVPTARVQVIHNSADLAAAQVDVWLNNTLLLDDLAFRTATPFVDVQAGVPFDISVALPTSIDTSGALAKYTYTLEEGGRYVLVANGIVSQSGYVPLQPFNIYVQADAREVSNDPTEVDVLVFHGSTDAPMVDVVETGVGAGTIVNGLSYGDFAGYLELPEADFELTLENSGAPIAAYSAPLATLGLAGNAITVLASGFLDPAMNNGGPDFGLWVALPGGGPLVPLSFTLGLEDRANEGALVVFPNPTAELAWVAFEGKMGPQVDVQLFDGAGRPVRTAVADARQAAGQAMPIDMSTLAAGTYYLRLSDGERVLTAPVHKR